MLITRNNKGFSLLEISLVLLALGFILASVYKGSTYLKNASSITQIISQVSAISNATYKFGQKYGYWPGDYNGFGNSSVDGNGNGYIDVTNWDAGNERIRAFAALSRVGLLEGDYYGTWHSSNQAPKGPIEQSWYYFGSYYLVSSGRFTQSTNVLTFAIVDIPGATAQNNTELAVMNAKMLAQLDEKIDDGHPLTGQVQAGFDVACYDTPSNSYATSKQGDNCVLYYILQNL